MTTYRSVRSRLPRAKANWCRSGYTKADQPLNASSARITKWETTYDICR
jgi:hypothetical protein